MKKRNLEMTRKMGGWMWIMCILHPKLGEFLGCPVLCTMHDFFLRCAMCFIFFLSMGLAGFAKYVG